jgi:hypothetical protein
VATFLVLRQLPGLTRDQYAAAQQAISDAARKDSSTGGHIITYLGGFFIPDKGRVICIFCAESPTDVATVNEQAGVPFTEVLRAIELRSRSGD